MRVMHKYRFQRHRADGTDNETVALASFAKWLKEAEEGDRFFVGRTDWVEVEADGLIPTGSPAAGDVHVSKLGDTVEVSKKDAERILKILKKEDEST